MGVLSQMALLQWKSSFISSGKHPGCLSPLGSEFVNINVAGQAVLARLKVLDVFYCCWGIVGEGEH